MSVEEEYIDRAGHALKEVFSDFVIIGIPIDREKEPILVQHGNQQQISAAVRIAEENINGNRHKQCCKKPCNHGS